MEQIGAVWAYATNVDHIAWVGPSIVAIIIAVVGALWKIFGSPTKVRIVNPIKRKDFSFENQDKKRKLNRLNAFLLASIAQINCFLEWATKSKDLFRLWFCYWVPGVVYAVPEAVPTKSERLYQSLSQPTVFYEQRFAAAFPALRRPKAYTKSNEIAHRLSRLLSHPLSAESDDGGNCATPIWWTRGLSDMHFDHWYRIKPKIFLIDHMELRLTRLLAIPGRAYWQNFIYVECGEQSPTGLYDVPGDLLDGTRGRPYSEEYAVYKGRKYTREEYDDGGFERCGKARSFKWMPQLRERYITPFNFLIVPAGSPVRGSGLAMTLNRYLDGLLDGSVSEQQLIDWLLSLPRNH